MLAMDLLNQSMESIQMDDHCTQTVVSNGHAIDHLHADVLSLVFEQLLKASPSTLPAVSRVCRLFHELVDPFIYRNLVLGTSWQTDSNLEQILGRILDDTSKVRNYVRNVNVGTSIDIKLLEPALSSLTRLESIVFRDFSWEALQDVGLVELLEKLSRQSPRVKVHVTARDDVHGCAELLNLPFLNSTNLNSLATRIRPDFHRLPPFASDLARLKRLIVSCKSLRILELDIDELPGEEPPCFDLDDGDQFPPLKELVLRGYSFTQENCTAWGRCMDWSQLRRLSFGTDYQLQFMQSFRDQLPNLRGFTTGIRVDDSVDVLDLFVSSLKLLEELEIRNFNEENVPVALLTRAGKSLLTLDYLSHFVRVAKQPPVLPIDEIETLAFQCPRLEKLVLGIELREGWPYDILAALARFSLLQHLVIHVEIDANHVAVLDPVIGKATAKILFEFIRAQGPASKLTKLDIVFETCMFNWDVMYRHAGQTTLRGGTISCSISERGDRPGEITIESDDDRHMKQLGKRFKPGSAEWMRGTQRYESRKLGPQVRRYLAFEGKKRLNHQEMKASMRAATRELASADGVSLR